MVVSCLVTFGTWTQILGKSSKFSELLSHFSSSMFLLALFSRKEISGSEAPNLDCQMTFQKCWTCGLDSQPWMERTGLWELFKKVFQKVLGWVLSLYCDCLSLLVFDFRAEPLKTCLSFRISLLPSFLVWELVWVWQNLICNFLLWSLLILLSISSVALLVQWRKYSECSELLESDGVVVENRLPKPCVWED